MCEIEKGVGILSLERSGFSKHQNVYKSITFYQKNKDALIRQFETRKFEEKKQKRIELKKWVENGIIWSEVAIFAFDKSIEQAEQIISKLCNFEKTDPPEIMRETFCESCEQQSDNFEDLEHEKIRKIVEVFGLSSEDSKKLLQKNNFYVELTIDKEKRKVVKQIKCTFGLSEQNAETLCSFTVCSFFFFSSSYFLEVSSKRLNQMLH
jgi:hypothetical protein